MNLIEIVKNAPEGAQRYMLHGGEHDSVEYYAVINGDTHYYNDDSDCWVSGDEWRLKLATPLPRLKTEYRKVEDSIWDLRANFEAGELYIKTQFDNYEKIEDLVTLALALNTKACFYRADKIIDERDEFSRKIDKLIHEHGSNCDETLFDFLYSKRCRFID